MNPHNDFHEEEKPVKVKRKFLRKARQIPRAELDANDIQTIVLADYLEVLEDGI